MICFALGLTVKAGAYLYMDRVLFAPLASGDYDMSDVKDKVAEAAEKEGKKTFSKVNVKGKAYYSYDYKYMADVTADSVTIYKAENLSNPQKVDLKNQGVSFFEWMPDRNLALMALYPIHWNGGRWDVTLARYNPEGTTHESDAPIRDLPRDAKIVSVAYSTATNAVYMKMEVGKGMFLVQGFFEMFETLLSYFSNTISFIRIGAFAVSHAAIMEVVLQLAGAESGHPNWIGVIFGNLFVCGFEGLIVGIQVLRLEYYEMFSRFYKGSGHAFDPYTKKKTNKK